jgi:hypothetical protein
MSKAWKEKPIKSVRVKLHNRRVTVSLCRDGGYRFKWTRLENGKPIHTHIALSYEATIATIKCILSLANSADQTRQASPGAVGSEVL